MNNNDTIQTVTCCFCHQELTDPTLNPWATSPSNDALCLDCIVSNLRPFLHRLKRKPPGKPPVNPPGRPRVSSPEALLNLLSEPMSSELWQRLALSKLSISRMTFYRLKKSLEITLKIEKIHPSKLWKKISNSSVSSLIHNFHNSNHL